jgi:rubrerythrin
MAKFDADKLLSNITGAEVLKAKEDLIYLFNMEVKSRDIYFQELRKFEGSQFETIKWLADQEAKHIQIIESLLSKANVIVKEQRTQTPKFDSDIEKIIKFDLVFEDAAVKSFLSASKKTTGALSELLSGLMDEEIVHVEKLKKYISTN